MILARDDKDPMVKVVVKVVMLSQIMVGAVMVEAELRSPA
jgi:hypothetical protein